MDDKEKALARLIIGAHLKGIWGVDRIILNNYSNLYQAKLPISKIPSTKLYQGFLKLKTQYAHLKSISIKILFVSEGEMQLIVGYKEHIDKLSFDKNTSDFVITIC